MFISSSAHVFRSFIITSTHRCLIMSRRSHRPSSLMMMMMMIDPSPMLSNFLLFSTSSSRSVEPVGPPVLSSVPSESHHRVASTLSPRENLRNLVVLHCSVFLLLFARVAVFVCVCLVQVAAVFPFLTDFPGCVPVLLDTRRRQQ